jgi:4-amino-4-deoxy-L-arabinose transferase-like glycosyltransferase
VHLGTQVADEIAFLLAVLVVFLVTKKMYGTTSALITTALTSTFPIYQFATSRNYAEPLVLAIFTLTLFFILESLKSGKENRIIIAGLTAGVGFLVKSSMGYLFIVAAVAGFLWRFYYVRWRAVKNRNYMLAVAVFVSVLLAWTVRDVYRFWDGTVQSLFAVASQPSGYMSLAMDYAFSHLGSVFVVTLIFSMFAFFYLLGYTWFFGDCFRMVAGRIREERVSLLVLAVVLPLFIGLVITGVYFVYENSIMPVYVSYLALGELRYFMTSFGRYSFIVFVPLSWLAYEVAKRRLSEG